MAKDLYEDLSNERKEHQRLGLMPEWYTTASWQMFKSKYLHEASSVKEQFQRIAKTAAKHLKGTSIENIAEEKFFEMLWNGWLSPSTPVLANMGTTRGLPVSCSGSEIQDSIDGFYSNRHETAMLTKFGFGTSADLSKIRPRGSKISRGGKSSGAVPVFKGVIQDMRDVAQGTARRGAWAGYLDIEHGDFDELSDFIMAEPDDANVGWIIKDSFIEKLESGELDSIRRFQKTMKLKMVTGKGYYSFIDKINRKRPKSYINNNKYVKASNLCNETCLCADEEHTFTCVLSSNNVARYREWKDKKVSYWTAIFLDCVASEFIEMSKTIPGVEKAVRFTEKGRALGIGQCGFHTLLQNEMIAFESLQAQLLSQEIAKLIWEESLEASKFLAKELGEPEWCKGLGVRNTHLIAIAPTKSTANLMGGVSEGINPDPAMVYTQQGSAGEIERVNLSLFKIMNDRGVWNKKTLKELKEKMGSVQHVDWLSDDEKKVFKTAFEINQEVILRMASARSAYVDQWMSLNLFFGSDEDPAWISHIHKLAFLDENILGLYYIYTQSGVQASKGECEACS